MTSTPTPAKRSKTMSTDGPTCKFLYTIMKQLDLKSIDWNLVASQLDISNGHAARMRYCRFKQQMQIMEGIPPSSKSNSSSSSNNHRPKNIERESKYENGSTKTSNQAVAVKNSVSPSPMVPMLESRFESGTIDLDGDCIANCSFSNRREPWLQDSFFASIPSATLEASMTMPVQSQSQDIIVPDGSLKNQYYPPVATVAPTDLMLQDPPIDGFHSSFGFDDYRGHSHSHYPLNPQHNAWVPVPVKMEQEDYGCYGDVLVKMK